jgi:hypothetical protein
MPIRDTNCARPEYKSDVRRLLQPALSRNLHSNPGQHWSIWRSWPRVRLLFTNSPHVARSIKQKRRDLRSIVWFVRIPPSIGRHAQFFCFQHPAKWRPVGNPFISNKSRLLHARYSVQRHYLTESSPFGQLWSLDDFNMALDAISTCGYNTRCSISAVPSNRFSGTSL